MPASEVSPNLPVEDGELDDLQFKVDFPVLAACGRSPASQCATASHPDREVETKQYWTKYERVSTTMVRMRGRKQWPCDFCHRLPGRQTMLVRVRRLSGGNSQRRMTLHSIRDTTGQKLADMEVGDLRTQFRTTLASIGDAIINIIGTIV